MFENYIQQSGAYSIQDFLPNDVVDGLVQKHLLEDLESRLITYHAKLLALRFENQYDTIRINYPNSLSGIRAQLATLFPDHRIIVTTQRCFIAGSNQMSFNYLGSHKLITKLIVKITTDTSVIPYNIIKDKISKCFKQIPASWEVFYLLQGISGLQPNNFLQNLSSTVMRRYRII